MLLAFATSPFMAALLHQSGPGRRPWVLIAGLAMALGVGLLDVVTGVEINLALLYLLPVCFVAWYGERADSISAVLFCGAVWMAAEYCLGPQYSHPAIFLWNAAVRIGTFALVAVLLGKLHATLQSERNARATALEATRAKSEFLAKMSHELRTPLNALFGVADLLAETRLSPEQAQYLEMFRVEGEQLRRLINDILDSTNVADNAPLAALGPVKGPTAEAPGVQPTYSRPPRLLVVEDYHFNMMLVLRFLAELGADIDKAETGRVAVDRVQASEYDLVLMDVQMPEMDGLAATRSIRSWERAHGRPATPIIALTASVLNAERNQCFAAGCTGFIAKPVKKQELLAAVRRVLNLPAGPVAGTNPPAKVRVDPEIASLTPRFLEAVREGLLEIRRASADKNMEIAIRRAHQIAGTGGSYGFHEISELGRKLETAAKAGDSVGLAQFLTQLETYLATVEIVYE